MNQPPAPPIGPNDLPTTRAATAAALAALHERLPRLLLAAPRDAHAAATLTRLTRQIASYLEQVGRQLAAAAPASAEADGGAPRQAAADDTLARTRSEAEQLLALLDGFLAAPDAEPHRRLLEDTVIRITGTQPARPSDWPDPPPAPAQTPAHLPTSTATGEAPRLEIHRLDSAERDWWQGQLEALRRRTNLALLLAIIASAALAAHWLDDAPLPRPRPAAPTAADPAASAQPPPAWRPDPAAPDRRPAPERPERLAELEVQVLRLTARLDALETPQVAADRPPPHEEQQATTDPPAPPPAPALAQPVPDPPAAADQPSLEQVSYGIQIAAVPRRDLRAFIAEHALDPQRIHIETTRAGVIIISGLFTDKAQAREALNALPANLKRLRPFVRTFAPGKQPPVIASEPLGQLR
ncbi:SPOR domain-containing protein [uncultured Thiodictyon sp.]|uniref:SPOR domain-containing protein n=1 Tax=uncultured Thiodictyon sp. TaxID=1846217 RepID=UPI0025EE5524|nr:SPOR domain-containing protein [uncultured Thiodictyon sp.]